MNRETVQIRTQRALNWVKANPGTDPNAYEMMGLFIEAAKYTRSDGYPPYKYEATTQIVKNIDELWTIRSKDMLNNNLGLTEESTLYLFLQLMYRAAITSGIVVNNEQSEEYFKKLAGICLYTKQKNRDIKEEVERGPIYNNASEYKELCKLREHYKKVKAYKDMDNITDGIFKEISVAFADDKVIDTKIAYKVNYGTPSPQTK